MKKPAKIFLSFPLCLFFVLVVALCLLGKETTLEYSAKVKPYSVVVQTRRAIRAANRASDRLILHLGDSSVAQPPWSLKDSPDIPTLLETCLNSSYPELGGVSVIRWAFAGARLFHYYCLLFEAEKYSPALLIIPINWRNLGPASWERSENFAFPELSAMVPLSERSHPPGKFLLQLEGISATKQLLYLSHYPMLYPAGLKTWLRTRLGIEPEEDPLNKLLEGTPQVRKIISLFADEQLFMQYPNDVPATNTRLHILRLLIDTAARHDIRLLFYITPIHIEEMRKRQPFDPVMFAASVETVMEAVSSETSLCVNLVELLGEDDFIDCFEHYTADGNRAIARALAPAVHALLQPAASTAPEPAPLAMGKQAP